MGGKGRAISADGGSVAASCLTTIGYGIAALCGHEFAAVFDPQAVRVVRVQFLSSLRYALQSQCAQSVGLPSGCLELLVLNFQDTGEMLLLQPFDEGAALVGGEIVAVTGFEVEGSNGERSFVSIPSQDDGRAIGQQVIGVDESDASAEPSGFSHV